MNISALAHKQEFRALLRHVATRYGQPMVTCDGVMFGDIKLNGRHEVEFIISTDTRTVYYRADGPVKLFDGATFTPGEGLADRIAEYAEQFICPKPCTALTIAPPSALVVAGHWERINIAHQLEDVLYKFHTAHMRDNRALALAF